MNDGDPDEDDIPPSDAADTAPSAAHPSEVELDIIHDGKRPRRSRKESPTDRQSREQRETDAFWRVALSDPIGRRVLWDIFCNPTGAHAFETRFMAGPSGVPDTHAFVYERAIQDFGLRVYRNWLRLDANAVADMHRENDHSFKPSEPR